MRVEIAHHLFQGGAAARVQRQVETGHLGHAADADAVLEAGDRHLVALVQDGRGRRHRRVGDRQGQRIALERVYRQAHAQRRQQLRRIAAQRDHVTVGGLQPAADAHPGDAVAVALQSRHVLVEAELDPGGGGQRGQFVGEQLAVAGLVLGQAQRADQGVGGAGQRRLHADDALAVQHFIRHAVLAQHLDVLGSGVQLLLGAEQLGGAQLAALVVDAGGRAQLVDAVAAVIGHAHHARLVDRIAAGGAVAQHLPQPAVLGDVGGRADGQWRVLLEQPLDRLQRHPGRGPRRGVAEGELAGVGEAGLQRRAGLPIHHRDLVARLSQVPGTGRADHTTAEYQNPHRRLLGTCARPAQARRGMAAGPDPVNSLRRIAQGP